MRLHHLRHDDGDEGRLDSPCVRRRCSYCPRHRLLFDTAREQQPSRRRYEFSEDESLVNSLSSGDSRRTTSVQPRRVESTASCRESKKKTKSEERVDFGEKEQVTHESRGAKSVATDRESTQSSVSEAFERLSLSSSMPRIVKPRDVLKRPATRKMMIYPPEGQRGEPLTLSKRRSKIRCRVSGDEETGFRYEVYYLQTFASDKWLPNDGTKGPFRRLDDPSDDSTDYGN